MQERRVDCSGTVWGPDKKAKLAAELTRVSGHAGYAAAGNVGEPVILPGMGGRCALYRILSIVSSDSREPLEERPVGTRPERKI